MINKIYCIKFFCNLRIKTNLFDIFRLFIMFNQIFYTCFILRTLHTIITNQNFFENGQLFKYFNNFSPIGHTDKTLSTASLLYFQLLSIISLVINFDVPGNEMKAVM